MEKSMGYNGKGNGVLTLEQSAEWLQVSKPTMYLWLKQRKLKGRKIGKLWRFYEEDLKKALVEHTKQDTAV